MSDKNKYIGRAFCSVLEVNPEYLNGMRGAFVTVACSAGSIATAIGKVSEELSEIALQVHGFENFYDFRYLEGVPTEYEEELLGRLSSYPVQFKNVHYSPPDS